MSRKVFVGVALATSVGILPLETAPTVLAAPLKLTVDSIGPGEMIPDKYTFCKPAAEGHAGPSANISPPLSWSKGPEGTQSYAVIVNDSDSPKENRDKTNKEGMTVPTASNVFPYGARRHSLQRSLSPRRRRVRRAGAARQGGHPDQGRRART